MRSTFTLEGTQKTGKDRPWRTKQRSGRKRCSFAPQSHPVGFGSLWRDCGSAGRADVCLRGVDRPKSWVCGHHHSDRHGRDAVYSDQLWPHGEGLSQRRLRVYLRWPGNQSGIGLHHGMGHGDGRPAESDDLHHLVQSAGMFLRLMSPIGRGRSVLRRSLPD